LLEGTGGLGRPRLIETPPLHEAQAPPIPPGPSGEMGDAHPPPGEVP
jgi:hypothetical protein